MKAEQEPNNDGFLDGKIIDNITEGMQNQDLETMTTKDEKVTDGVKAGIPSREGIKRAVLSCVCGAVLALMVWQADGCLSKSRGSVIKEKYDRIFITTANIKNYKRVNRHKAIGTTLVYGIPLLLGTVGGWIAYRKLRKDEENRMPEVLRIARNTRTQEEHTLLRRGYFPAEIQDLYEKDYSTKELLAGKHLEKDGTPEERELIRQGCTPTEILAFYGKGYSIEDIPRLKKAAKEAAKQQYSA